MQTKHAASARHLTRFARESLAEFEGLLAQRTVDYQLSHGGLMELFREDNGVAARDNYAGVLEGLGAKTIRLNAEDCVALEPSLAPIAATIRAGLHLPDDAWGDARRFTLAAEAAARGLSVEFNFDTHVKRLLTSAGRIEGIETDDGKIEARSVVVCAGVASKRLLAPLGIRLPIEPVKGYSISMGKEELGFLPGRPILDDTARLGVTPLGDHLRVAGTVEFDGYNPTLRSSRIQNLILAFKSLFPDVRRQNIWRRLQLRLAECRPRLWVDVMRLACGAASADVRWSGV